ncbi:hypothetical protein HMPREF0381_2520 [Lachnoanaerobaculum saburreum DSM 3986]|jgi:hypothetical protein|uniref:Uncharacterized protein n=2 Tax=Lachnoanaerobaculum saburreum TaxID=467210 RepID=E6LRD5_9FIRM|nr:hypothetical protein [Lachnoanaerobaculum saburreum]EFU75599.1 hypothetical protein HMPREF0381_2520 [Lachnoanaerobaculum saburreum DSM 3986]
MKLYIWYNDRNVARSFLVGDGMLNEEKIRQMTELALLKKSKGEQMFEIDNYFKEDYVGKHMLRSFFVYTVCFALVVVLAILYNLENLMSSMNPIGLLSVIYILIYVLGLLRFEIITYRFFSKKYDEAQKDLKIYNDRLNYFEKKFDNKDKLQNNGG